MIPLIISLLVIYALPFFPGMLLRDTKCGFSSKWWFGLTLTGIILVIIHGLRIPFWGALVLISILSIAGIVLGTKPNSDQEFAKIWPCRLTHNSWEFIPRIVLFLILVASSLSVLSTPITPANWDAIGIWYKKIKLLYDWVPLSNSPVNYWGAYLNYPNLGPLLETWVLKAVGSLEEEYGRLLMPALYFFWMNALILLAPKNGRRIFMLFYGYAVILFFNPWAFTSGYQEGFILALAGMASIHFCRFLKANRMEASRMFPGETDLFLGFFFSGALCLVKNEASILAFILCLSFSFVLIATASPKKKILRWLALYWLLFLALASLWPILLIVNHADITHLQNRAFTPASFVRIGENLSRLPVIEPYFIRYFIKHGIFLTLSFLMTLIAFIWKDSRKTLTFLWIAYISHIFFMPLPYLVTNAGLGWHLENSFDRLMLQHSFFYPMVITLAFAEIADKLFKIPSPENLPQKK